MFNRCFQPESVFSTRGVSSKISQDNFTLRPDPESQVQEFEAGGCQAGRSHHSRTHPVGKTQSGYQCFSAPGKLWICVAAAGQENIGYCPRELIEEKANIPFIFLTHASSGARVIDKVKIYIQNL